MAEGVMQAVGVSRFLLLYGGAGVVASLVAVGYRTYLRPILEKGSRHVEPRVRGSLGASEALLHPKEYSNFKLIEKIPISHNTALYRFGLPNKEDVLGLPIGQHISVMAEINGKQISRSYTPTSTNEDTGCFDLVIKSYPTGNISKLFGELEVGDRIAIRGPKGNFAYSPNMVRAIGMIAGGTGITPMLQIIRAICRNPNDKTEVNLIFANVDSGDILLKKELDELAIKHKNFKVYYVLNNAPEDWKEGIGFVSSDMIREYCPAPANDIKILLCGPPPMVSILAKATSELGYEKPRAVSRMEDQVFKF
ncbi:NADH-cytochrome b5 reductase [Apophysomyces sp. BC1021]|nr:NADH-cytochrome b5 reductase [Apophysomyces sp. BC1021]